MTPLFALALLLTAPASAQDTGDTGGAVPAIFGPFTTGTATATATGTGTATGTTTTGTATTGTATGTTGTETGTGTGTTGGTFSVEDTGWHGGYSAADLAGEPGGNAWEGACNEGSAAVVFIGLLGLARRFRADRER